MLLNQLSPPKGATKNKKRLGRGESSGLGKTSGKGHKGQKARSGGYHKVGFEGGQMPLVRRIPKRGFHNIFSLEYAVINVSDLEALNMVEIDIDLLKSRDLVKKAYSGLKVLGDGELKRAITVKAKKFSKTAVAKIEKAGGKAVVI
jgi:large subunit ribosomal protein L15